MTRPRTGLAPTPADGDRAPTGLRGAAPIIALLVFAILVAAAAFVMHRGLSWRDEFPIREAWLDRAGTLSLVVDTCLEIPQVTALDETDAEVRVTVESTRRIGGPGTGDCRDAVEVTLQASLGDRTLIDTTTGEPVTLTR